MPATFPNSVRVYTTKTDLVDTVLAEHVNLLQDEVTAVQATLGTGLLASSWSGTYTNPSTHATVAGRLVNIEAGLTSLDTLKAAKASPTFTGTPSAPTAAVDTSTTQLATTAFVLGQAGSSTPATNGTAAVGTSLRYARADHVHGSDTTRAPVASPTFTGTVTLPLSTAGFVKTTSSGVISASSSVAQSEVSGLSTSLATKADLASPALTGTPTAPTATTTTNSTQLATTAYVVSRIASDAPTKTGSGASGTWGIDVSGSASSLSTPRTITLSGDISGSGSFDGTANLTISASLTSAPPDLQPLVATFLMAGL